MRKGNNKSQINTEGDLEMEKSGNEKSILWRKFHKCAEGILCAILLLAVIISSLALESCGNKNNKDGEGKKILIAYETKHGSTAFYAEKIGEVLRNNGYEVDIDRVLNLLEIDLSSYDGAIVGSPVYWAQPLPGISTFLDKHKTKLANMPVAWFTLSFLVVNGKVPSFVFWYFNYWTVLSQYPDIFSLTPCPTFPFCPSVPYWVGLMPGKYIPRSVFPLEYILMEFAGYKAGDFLSEEAASEYAQDLIDYGFFQTEPNISPTLFASGSPSSGTEPLTVQFTADADDPDGTIISYSWAFGDGSYSDAQNPEHTYQCDGTYNAIAQVIDDKGAIVEAVVEITVEPGGGPLTYDCDIQPIFDLRCTICHGGSNLQKDLNLENCEGLLAGSPSYPILVVPGDAEASELYQKITVGEHHPEGLDQSELDIIVEWINSLDPLDPNYCD